jgi:hypothetical protein
MHRNARYGSELSRRASRYDKWGYGRTDGGYGRDFGRYGTPMPGAEGYPSARWGWGPIGWAGMGPAMEAWPYAPIPGYGFDGSVEPRGKPPRRSETYGRGGDRALQRWARRYGYDMSHQIRPRRRS